MTISVNLTDTPVGVTVSANGGSVNVSAATVTAVQVGIGNTAIPSTHGGTHSAGGSDPVTISSSQVSGLQTLLDSKASTSHASSHSANGSDPITVGTVPYRFVKTTTGGKLTTASGISTLEVTTDTASNLSSIDGLVNDAQSYGLGGAVARAIAQQDVTVKTAFVDAPAVSGNAADYAIFNAYYDANTVFGVSASGDVTVAGNLSVDGNISGTVSAANLSGTILPARLPVATSTALGGVIVGSGLTASSGTVSVTYGTTSNTACQGNDSRLSDARTPTAHAVSHANGGSDAISIAASQVTSGTMATARLASGTASSSTYLRGDQTWATISTYTLPDATTSTKGGVIVGTGLSVSGGTVGVSYGSTSTTACAGNDSRLANNVRSLTTGITGSTAVTNCVSISQAAYDALSTKDSSTLYVIV